jgi:selenocysteine lyase/cysteine desulfurase
VVVTSLDHDANIRPWVLAAERAGATVRWAEFGVQSGELALDQFDSLIGERTRLVAVTAASNAIGTKPDVRAISEQVHQALGAVEEHLDRLLSQALAGLRAIPGVRLLGHARRRTSTVSFVVEGHAPGEVSRRLAGQGIAVWDGDNYAYELMHRFGLRDQGGAVRASIVLYNDEQDVERLVEAVSELSAGGRLAAGPPVQSR